MQLPPSWNRATAYAPGRGNRSGDRAAIVQTHLQIPFLGIAFWGKCGYNKNWVIIRRNENKETEESAHE
jgi:hypothetical protein